MRWFALAFVLASAVQLFVAWRMDRSSSFDDGTFAVQMLITFGGMGSLVVGIVLGIVALMFIA